MPTWNEWARWQGFPLEWQADRTGRGESSASRVAVVLHLYHRHLIEEVLSRLHAIPEPFDVFITHVDEPPDVSALDRLPLCNRVEILRHPNQGRDILPLISLVNSGHLDSYEVILKIHTKLSTWRRGHELPGSGAEWRGELLDSTLRDRAQVSAILEALRSTDEIGIVTDGQSILGEQYWGSNKARTLELLRRLEIRRLRQPLEFPAGSIYWCRAFVLQGLRSLCLRAQDFEEESGQQDGTTAHAIERLIGAVTREAGLSITSSAAVTSTPNERTDVYGNRSQLVAFYLPQYHRVGENDTWWGPGFTEWTNVTAAKPVFEGHHQPKLPRDLGFYSLGDPAVAPRQEALAQEAGLAAFMYYFYWFGNRSLLRQPLDDRLKRVGGLPFCIMWANENWTRTWDGSSKDILAAQDYSGSRAADFIDLALPYISHPDYYRVNGRALIAIYRPAQIPNCRDVFAAWRLRAHQQGLGELHLLAVDVGESFDGIAGDPEDFGLDGRLAFPPHRTTWKRMNAARLGAVEEFRGEILSYARLVESEVDKLECLPDDLSPGVMTGFDNTARRQFTPHIWYGANPYTFRRWLAAAVAAVNERHSGESLVFINAWNEWAEGAVLEPSARFGRTYLQAARDVSGWRMTGP